jgi:hypothetical protein
MEGQMSHSPPLAPLPVANRGQAGAIGQFDADFEARWTTWVERGREHERLGRRRLGVLAVVLAAAALVYAFL